MAPEVRVPGLRKPNGEQAQSVSSVPSSLRSRARRPAGSFLMPQGRVRHFSVLFPFLFPGCNRVGGDQ